MSRVHAFLIAIFVAGAVAVGAATAFTIANSPDKPGTALSNELLKARADAINKGEKQLAKKLKDNPKPDTSPITKVVTTGGSDDSSSGSTTSTSGSTTSTSGGSVTSGSSRHDDDDHFDDHGGDRSDDRSDDHSGSGSSGSGSDHSGDDD
jgi:hypothetical protein